MDVSKAIDYTEVMKSGCEEKKKVEEKGFESESQNHSAWKGPPEIIRMIWYSSNGS